MKTRFRATYALAALASTSSQQHHRIAFPTPGTNTAAPNSQPAAQTSRAALPAPTAQGQPYDFYLLNLSWSPEFCHSHPDSPECAAHPGFVVHGLWPQNNDGTYPEHCPSRPGPTSDADWQGPLLPTASASPSTSG